MKRLLLILAVVLAVGAVTIRVAMFGTGVRAIPTFDDECKISLQAKQIARGHFPLLILASPYIFPLEAYLQAPFIHVLPRNAFGARIQVFGMGFVAILLSLLILRRWGSWRETWPGIALVLFPSAYLMILQVGCALPGYPTLMLLAVLIVWLGQRHAESERRLWVYALLGGIAGGLAASDTMLALPLLIAGGAMIAVGRSLKTALISAPVFGIGAFIGLSPHLAAKYLNKSAFHAVQQNVSLREGLDKILSPLLDPALPTAFGWAPTIFPDHKDRIPWIEGFDLYVGVALVVLLSIFTAVVLWNFFRRWKQERWPRVDAGMAFAGIAWMCLALFVLSGRSHSHTYRYCIPFVLGFPFLLAYTYRQSGRSVRWILGLLTVLLVAMNIVASAGVIRRWATPGFADYLKSYDMKPVFAYLDQRGITRCYATYTDAYRITFETDERILCSQPFNERFPGWHVPFSDIVNAATNVAFVLSDSYRFQPDVLERDCATMQVTYRVETCGHYRVYTDFESQLPLPGREVPAKDLSIVAFSNLEDLGRLTDGDLLTRWQSRKAQEKGMAIEIHMASPRPVSIVKVYYNQYRHDRARVARLQVFQKGKWTTVLNSISRKLDCFDFLNGHPVYMNDLQTLRFPRVKTDRLRLEIVDPEPGRDWTMGEIKVFEPD